MKKKDLIFISIILMLLISLVFTIFYFKRSNDKIITGEVISVGSNYLLITTSNNEDYVINTTTEKYQVGDELELLITNIKTNKTPYEATVKDITVIASSSNLDNSQDSSIDDNIHEDTNTSDNNYQNNQNNTDDNYNSNNSNNGSDDINSNNEGNVIRFFENLDNKLTSYNNGDENLGKTIKSNFVSCIDFIFYNKEINGTKFNELANAAKLKILAIALSIDSKIDEKIPGYKDTISSSYQNMKVKIIEKYLETTTNICNNDPDLCVTAKEGFSDLKTNFGITWDIVKELANNGVAKLKDWYEIWRYQ